MGSRKMVVTYAEATDIYRFYVILMQNSSSADLFRKSRIVARENAFLIRFA